MSPPSWATAGRTLVSSSCLMATRRPPSDVLERAYNRIASDRFLFSEGRENLLKDISESLKSATLTEVGS